jgi:cytidine diphosphoramidate kinase
MVIWIIGMSASGKTTIGKKLFETLENSSQKWVFLDGDTFRNILGEDLGHTLEDRRKNAYRMSRLCEYFASQGINVLACVLSIFHDNQKYNKENIKNYKEVYIDVEFDNLLKRDNKELYKRALNSEIENVVGVDIEFKPPFAPDVIIDNNLDNPNYQNLAQKIIDELEIKIYNTYSYTLNDLLEHPQKYEYSKFEGVNFFKQFSQERNETLDFLDTRLKKITEVNNVNNFELDLHEFKTKKDLILKEFLIFLYLGDRSVLEKQESFFEILIKRFEVSKKLYLTYNIKDIRKSSKDFNELISYCLFSLVLQRYYDMSIGQQKLVYLNSILKVNDIISSTKSNLIFANEVYYALKAINGELKILGEYI